MRPAGVRQRIERLQEEERANDRSRPRLALRRALTWLIHGSALLSCGDVGAGAVVGVFREVLELLDDPAQHRTGSELETASLDCVSRLEDGIAAERAADPHRHAGLDEAAEPELLRIPPRVLIGRDTPDAFLPMACLNAAGSYVDGVISPYRATTLITGIGYFEPGPERDLLAATRDLRTKYEDHPRDRPTTATEIDHELRTWLDGR